MKPVRSATAWSSVAIVAAAFALAGAAEPPRKSKTAPAEAPPQPRVPEGVEVISDVLIGKGGDKPLHAEIARPKEPSRTPLPAVIWIHGGGWSRGSYKENRALPLAAQGYFTASIQYRLSGEATWPAQIEDCKLAVRWLRANAKKYNVDPDRIGVWGSSAGGHLVSCLGVMGGESQFEGAGGYPGVSSRVQAVVNYCGPADMTRGSAGIQRATGDTDAPAPLGLFGAPFKERPDLWRQGSPVVYVKPDAAPFLIVHGDQDATVPIAHSEKLAAALKQAGVPVEFIIVKGGAHNMSAPPGEPPAQPDRAALDAAVLSFFDKHLKK